MRVIRLGIIMVFLFVVADAALGWEGLHCRPGEPQTWHSCWWEPSSTPPMEIELRGPGMKLPPPAAWNPEGGPCDNVVSYRVHTRVTPEGGEPYALARREIAVRCYDRPISDGLIQ